MAQAIKAAEKEADQAVKRKGLSGLIKKYFPEMDKSKVEELITHSKAAYDSEMEQDWMRAFELHEKAIQLWDEFAKSARRFSKMERVYKLLALKRSDLHKRRVKILEPIAKGGKPVPETMIMHPSLALTMLGISEYMAPGQMPMSEQFTNQSLAFTSSELQYPQQLISGFPSYTDSLPQGLPPTEYWIRRKAEPIEHMVGNRAGLDLIVYTVLDSTKQNEILILEAYACSHPHMPHIQEAIIYRPADYPVPAMNITTSHHNRMANQRTSVVISTEVRGLPKPIVEIPDRLRRGIWTPRRFAFGGRAFARKKLNPDKRTDWAEGVFEYTQTSPKPGSKTGKKDDDAHKTPLFWIENHGMFSKEFRCFAAGGLDPLFKEYLFAGLLMKLAATQYGCSTTMTEEEIAAAAGADLSGYRGGMLMVRGMIGLIMILSLAG